MGNDLTFDTFIAFNVQTICCVNGFQVQKNRKFKGYGRNWTIS